MRKLKKNMLDSGCRMIWSLRMGIGALALVFVVFLGSLGYSHFMSLLPEGTVFRGEDLAGLTRKEALQVMSRVLTEQPIPKLSILIQKNGDSQVVDLETASQGLQYDPEATLDALLERGSLYSADLVSGHAAAPSDEVIFDGLDETFSSLLSLIKEQEIPAEPARIEFQDGAWILVPEQNGFLFSEEEQRNLHERFSALGKTMEGEEVQFSVEMQQVLPAPTQADLEAVYQQLTSQMQRVITLDAAGKKFDIKLQDHPEWFHVDEQQMVQIDEEVVRTFVNEWMVGFEQSAGQVSIAAPESQPAGHLMSRYEGSFSPGRKVHADKVFQQLIEALKSSEPQVSLSVEVEMTAPSVVLDGVGPLEMLSQGRSSYALAHGEEREFNVKKGMKMYDGVVIPQGAEFSLNQVLGIVSYEAGWKPALAIFGGGGVQPVPGGGLCQVATTMYRSAIHAGLPISYRKPHSLDVSYYWAYGDGLDATIYPPEDIDLRFVNDTPGPIFIHTYIDEVAQEPFMEFYGISDGRSVELTQTINRPVKLDTETVYVPDLPAGVKEVIKPRVGRYVEWDWVIKRADGSQEKRVIETLYPARRMTVRVGTGG